MKSLVTFRVDPNINVDTGSSTDYLTTGISSVVSDGLLKELKVLLKHEDAATPPDIFAMAREQLRDLISLLSFGRHEEIRLNQASIYKIEPRDPHVAATGMITITNDAYVVNALRSLPAKELLERLGRNKPLRQQIENLIAARAARGNITSQVARAFMVLEQEEKINGYSIPERYTYLRHSVSHAFLSKTKPTEYFKEKIGVPYPDLGDPKHVGFLENEAMELLNEATRIVESHLSDHKFW